METNSQAMEVVDNASEKQTPDQNQIGVRKPSKLSNFNLIFSVSTFLFLIVGVVNVWGPITQYRNTDPQLDGYVQPRSIADLVQLVQDSTVSIYCEYGNDGDFDLGTGWALDIETDRENEYPTAIVTNHHVIE